MSAFLPLPGCPGYAVNRLGQVKGKSGLLSVDAQGRVNLRDGQSKKYRKLYIGQLMDAAGLLKAAGVPEPALVEAELSALRQERDTARRELAALSGRVTEAQRVNRHNRSLNAALWCRLRSLEAALTATQDTTRKHTRIAAERTAWEVEGAGILEDISLPEEFLQ